MGDLGQGRMYLPVSRSFCPWTVFNATFLKSRLVVDYSLIFAVSELLLLYESVLDFDGDGDYAMMVMKTVLTGVC